jgi:hypothetical protein
VDLLHKIYVVCTHIGSHFSMFTLFANTCKLEESLCGYIVSYILSMLYMLLLVPCMYVLQTSFASLNSLFGGFKEILPCR